MAERVFLSHSGKDKEFVKELYRRLTRDGVSCFFDIESIGWGANWVRALERAIDECEFIVFVLSPDFCNSEWVEVERTGSIADDPIGLKRKVRPLMLRQCRDLRTFPRFLKQTQAIDVSNNERFEVEYPRICKGLGGTVRGDSHITDRTKLPPVSPLPQRSRMPFAALGDRFVGRVEPFWELHDSLYHNSTTVVLGTSVVIGTGGLGKTQLAIEYAHRFGVAYTGGVYWVDADRGLSTLIIQVSGAAGIEVDTKAEETVQVGQIWTGLNRFPGPSLLILDNFPETIPLRPYLPTTGRVHTLITSRRRDLQYPSVRLNVLTAEESLRLLNSGARKLGEDAAVLVERLGGLPLALELAKSYLNYRIDLSISRVQADMSSVSDTELLEVFAEEYRDELPSGHELDVVRTFQMSWDVASEPARKVLRVMGELAPAAVPRFLLRSILEIPGDGGVRDPLAKAISELGRLSLVDLDEDGDPVAHRLIIAFAAHRNKAESAASPGRCIEVIQSHMKRAFESPGCETIRQVESVLPHAEFLVAGKRLPPQEAARLANRLGWQHRTSGRYMDARRAFTTALSLAQEESGPGHYLIAFQSNLALVLNDLGQSEEASHLLREVLTASEKTHEPGHPSVALAQSNLALVLRDLHELQEAGELLRRSLTSAESTFEPGHPTIAIRQSNLAAVLRDLGQLVEARDLLRQALASDEKTFESGHPRIATIQSDLALVLKDLGQPEGARGLLCQAVASDEKTYEPGHPELADKQSKLALVLKDLGKIEAARDLLKQAHQSFLDRLGPGHPKTRLAKDHLDALPPS